MTPIKARLSLVRQRVVLAIRYIFRLPIDEIKERQNEQMHMRLAEALGAASATITRLTQAYTELDARLRWYEDKVPALTKERKAFERSVKRQTRAKRV